MTVPKQIRVLVLLLLLLPLVILAFRDHDPRPDWQRTLIVGLYPHNGDGSEAVQAVDPGLHLVAAAAVVRIQPDDQRALPVRPRVVVAKGQDHQGQQEQQQDENADLLGHGHAGSVRAARVSEGGGFGAGYL